MRPLAASLTLVLQVAPSIPIPIPRRKKLATEPAFEHPPVWNHASVAEKCFLAAERAPLALTRPIEAGTARAGKQQIERKSVPSKREAKRRALLDLLDRIP